MAKTKGVPGAHPSRRRVLTYDQAFVEARRSFMRDAGLDMQRLADQLAVGRATLYRVVGSRERLIGDVLSDLSRRTLESSVEKASGKGLDRILSIARHYAEELVGFEPLRKFTRSDPQAAVRVLFMPSGGVHERTVQAWRNILTEAEESGEITLPFAADDVAYVFVRIGESILYSDILAGRDPDVELALEVERKLLGG